MGLLVEGRWVDRWYNTKKSGGRFVRQQSAFRDAVSADPGAKHAAEAGRYVLYVSYACPWAHRTMIFRTLKGLEDVIELAVVEPDMLDNGWAFSEERPDPVHGVDFMHQLYVKADPAYTGRVTVPVLWDRKLGTIVNNESSELIRQLDTAFTHLADPSAPFANQTMYPDALTDEIDALNDRIYDTLNNGVYKCGFATTQEAYDENIGPLFDTLDALEARLSTRRYLTGDQLTEADWRLFTTLIRFDAVYYSHFKCSRRRIADYPALSG
jgi:putative glutathione S-transferase